MYYSHPHGCLVWNCRTVRVAIISKALDIVNWDFIIFKKTVYYPVFIFNQILMNIYMKKNVNHLMPNSPLEYVKWKILLKRFSLNNMLEQRSSKSWKSLQFTVTHLSDLVTKRKNEYLFQLINNLRISAKTWWTILKIFYRDSKKCFSVNWPDHNWFSV